MKKYFIGYAPTGGKIQEFSVVISTKTNDIGTVVHIYESTGYCIVEINGVDKVIDFPISELMEIALYLCTKECNIGDTVFVEPNALRGYFNGLIMELVEIKEHIYEDAPNDKYYFPMLKYVKNSFRPESEGNIREWITENIWKPIARISKGSIKFVEENKWISENEINRQWYDDSGSDDQPWKDFLTGD